MWADRGKEIVRSVAAFCGGKQNERSGKGKGIYRNLPFFRKNLSRQHSQVVNMDVLEDQPTMYSIEEISGRPDRKEVCKWRFREAVCISLCSRELYGPAEK